MIGIWKEKIQELETRNRALYNRQVRLLLEIGDIEEDIENNKYKILKYETLISKGEDYS